MKQATKIAAAAMAAAGLWMYGGQLPVYAAAESSRAAAHLAESLPMTALTKVYGDGEKVAAAMIAYPKELNAADVGIKDFSVPGKKIASVHVNNKEDFTGSAKKGRYVFLEFAQCMTAIWRKSPAGQKKAVTMGQTRQAIPTASCRI